MIERCERCGANLAMVGRVHRCIRRDTQEVSGTDPSTPLTGGKVKLQAHPRSGPDHGSPDDSKDGESRGAEKSVASVAARKRAPRGTFDRRQYQREYMRKRRRQAEKKPKGEDMA